MTIMCNLYLLLASYLLLSLIFFYVLNKKDNEIDFIKGALEGARIVLVHVVRSIGSEEVIISTISDVEPDIFVDCKVDNKKGECTLKIRKVEDLN